MKWHCFSKTTRLVKMSFCSLKIYLLFPRIFVHTYQLKSGSLPEEIDFLHLAETGDPWVSGGTYLEVDGCPRTPL